MFFIWVSGCRTCLPNWASGQENVCSTLTCINPTERPVFGHNSHIQPNSLSRWVLVPMWPDKQGRTVFTGFIIKKFIDPDAVLFLVSWP